MIIVVLAVLGLCLGSFVNALVWRLHEQAAEADKPKSNKKYLKQLSIMNGRSMCPYCKHELAAIDLLPVLSWLSLGGKCRYCHRPVSAQYPIVELATAGLFVASYIWWPSTIRGAQAAEFGLWLPLLVGLMALLIYDLRWTLLPNKLVYPLTVLAAVEAVITVASADTLKALIEVILAVVIGGGLFYVLFQVSSGKWIGGGDVKLGWLLGLVVATPARAVLLIFLASTLGSLVSLPLLAARRLKPSSSIPFGPFLIIAAVIVTLFGHSILLWYQKTFLNITM